RHVGLGGGPEACGRGNILRRAGDCISRSGVGLRRRAHTAAVMIAISCSRLSHFRCDAADMVRYWWGRRLIVMSHDLNPRRFGDARGDASMDVHVVIVPDCLHACTEVLRETPHGVAFTPWTAHHNTDPMVR